MTLLGAHRSGSPGCRSVTTPRVARRSFTQPHAARKNRRSVVLASLRCDLGRQKGQVETLRFACLPGGEAGTIWPRLLAELSQVRRSGDLGRRVTNPYRKRGKADVESSSKNRVRDDEGGAVLYPLANSRRRTILV